MRDYLNKKSKIIQDYQNALINAANCISAAKGKINKFKQMKLELVGLKLSPEPTQSLSIRKRLYRESLPLRRGKKRR
jgi:hypothetical protein